MEALAIYLAAINLAALLAMSSDKTRARRRERRVPERTLLLLAVCGGSVGILLAMQIRRHKTRHRVFTVGVPLMLLAQAALLYAAFR